MTQLTREQQAEFRQEVGAFLDSVATERLREAGRKTTSVFSPFQVGLEFQKTLNERGWGGVSWPVEYGGTGWSPLQQKIFHEECRIRELPFLLPNALGMVGPAIMRYGTEEQKQRYLPAILSGEDYWAQGYSEPNAGSDLVSLKCRADRDGDHYVINGSKIWSTFAHLSNRYFMLVKTDTQCKPQRGITFLLLDSLSLPGMEVREIIGLDGTADLCEVFFDNVRVPVSCRLGDENDGWTVAKYLLEHERAGTTSFASIVKQELERVRALATVIGDGKGGKLVDDPVFQYQYADMYLDATTLDASELAVLSLPRGSGDAGPLSSMQKIIGTEILQKVSKFALNVTGIQALPLQLAALEVGSDTDAIGPADALTVLPKFLNNHAASIYGGSNEIQREIISRAILGR